MDCEWRPGCTEMATHRLTIRYLESGSQNAHYYCKTHGLMRISEIEDDDALEVLGQDEFRGST